MRFVEEITPPPEEYSTGTDPGENGEDRKRRRYRKGRFLCLLGAVMIILAVTVGNRQMTMKPETTEIEAASVETVPAAMETGSFETKTGTEAETETANEAESVTAPPETLPNISDTETKTDKSAKETDKSEKETETAAETKATKAADPQTQATQQTFSPTQGTKTESVTEESLLSSEQASSEETLSEEASEEETLEEESSEGETSEEESPEEENPEEESPEGESNSYGYATNLSGRTNGPTAPYESEPETPSLYEE